MLNRWEADQNRIELAISQFPATFALRGHSGLFRISQASSYVSYDTNSNGEVILYSEIESNGRWLSFAKGTVSEFNRNVVEVQS